MSGKPNKDAQQPVVTIDMPAKFSSGSPMTIHYILASVNMAWATFRAGSHAIQNFIDCRDIMEPTPSTPAQEKAVAQADWWQKPAEAAMPPVAQEET